MTERRVSANRIRNLTQFNTENRSLTREAIETALLFFLWKVSNFLRLLSQNWSKRQAFHAMLFIVTTTQKKIFWKAS